MNLSLTPDVERLVELKVQTGHYASASEVVREALSLMDERDRLLALERESIREKIDLGMAELASGEVVDGEAFFAEMERNSRNLCSADASESLQPFGVS